MSYRLFISDPAIKDLDDIWIYIAENNPENADRFIEFMFKKCEQLVDMPFIGRQRDELLPELRSFPVKAYVVFYRIQTEVIEIVRILSAYRDIESIFSEYGQT